jgi:hypothetical protein
VGVGYYYGAKAGRERFEQLERLVHRAGAVRAADGPSGKVRAALDLGVERARALVTSGHPAPPSPGRRAIIPPADPSLN